MVNAVCPGGTRTKMLVDSVIERGFDLDAMIEMIPAGHMAEEGEHAYLIAFFVSDQAA